MDRQGNLRISFQRGQFDKPEATQRAAYASALMVNDVQLDVIDSFHRLAAPAETAPRTQVKDIQILLEETDDNLNFVKLAQIDAGVTLIEAGAPASFVYVPLEAGLRIYPLSGYPRFLDSPGRRWVLPALFEVRREMPPLWPKNRCAC